MLFRSINPRFKIHYVLCCVKFQEIFVSSVLEGIGNSLFGGGGEGVRNLKEGWVGVFEKVSSLGRVGGGGVEVPKKVEKGSLKKFHLGRGWGVWIFFGNLSRACQWRRYYVKDAKDKRRQKELMARQTMLRKLFNKKDVLVYAVICFF